MDPVTPLDPAARELLGEYRRARPGPKGRARNWPGVKARLDAEPTRRGSSVRASLWFAGIAVALAAAILLIAHGGFVAWQAVQRERAAVPQAPDVVPPAAPAPIAPAPERIDAPEPLPATVPAVPAAAAPAVQRPQVARPQPAPVASPSAEVEIVAAARAAMQREDWAAALASLGSHAERFPHGVLAEDRSALQVIALCRSAAAGARDAVRSFNSRYPGSHHHRAIRHACASILDAPPP